MTQFYIVGSKQNNYPAHSTEQYVKQYEWGRETDLSLKVAVYNTWTIQFRKTLSSLELYLSDNPLAEDLVPVGYNVTHVGGDQRRDYLERDYGTKTDKKMLVAVTSYHDESNRWNSFIFIRFYLDYFKNAMDDTFIGGQYVIHTLQDNSAHDERFDWADVEGTGIVAKTRKSSVVDKIYDWGERGRPFVIFDKVKVYYNSEMLAGMLIFYKNNLTLNSVSDKFDIINKLNNSIKQTNMENKNTVAQLNDMENNNAVVQLNDVAENNNTVTQLNDVTENDNIIESKNTINKLNNIGKKYNVELNNDVAENDNKQYYFQYFMIFMMLFLLFYFYFHIMKMMYSR